MARKKAVVGERFFSMELSSRDSVQTASLGNGNGDRVTIEGTIGSLKRVDFPEDSALEILGTEGALRVDLSREDLVRLFKDRKGEGR